MPRTTVRDARPVTSRNTPDPILDTVRQTEEQHPALRGRLRKMIHRADAGDPELALLRLAIVRIGWSVFLSRPHFATFLEMHRASPPAPRRNNK